MNPWELLLNMLGWVLVGIVAIAALLFLFALIVSAVKVARNPKPPTRNGALDKNSVTVISSTEKGSE